MKISFEQHLPSQDLEICEGNFNLFFKSMFERQEIWYKRFILKEEAPWTTDPILRDNKFTNVYRELDRNSQYQIKNVFEVEEDKKELLWEIMFFRFFNCPEFFEFIREVGYFGGDIIPNHDEFDNKILEGILADFRSTGGNPFTTAYLTNTMVCVGKSRDWCFANRVIPHLHKSIDELLFVLGEADTPEFIIQYLCSFPSVAGFMSHEFYQDFTYAPRYANVELMKFDQDDFTNVGPGASTGIRLIYPNLKNGKQKPAIYKLKDLAEKELKKYGDFKYLGYKDGEYFWDKASTGLTLHQIEMWLCEFQKYWKMGFGVGKQRSKFTPKTKVI